MRDRHTHANYSIESVGFAPITLTFRDTARLLNLLRHPPKPTDALREAAERQRKRVRESLRS